MTWHFTEDPAVFRAAAGPLLAADPVRNTSVLTLVDAAVRLGWWTGPDGRVTGVLAVAPPCLPVLGTVTEEAARALASALPAGPGAAPAEVRGETGAVEAFARSYAEATGRVGVPTVRLRLFRLGTLTPPDPPPTGRARPAGAGDVPLLTGWAREFARDVGDDPDARDLAGQVTERVTEGRLLLWEAPGGRPVSMAAVSRTLEGQARVHLVYTPPAERGRGYAAGVTTAVSRAALATGATRVLLFTDLANPTSNALYARLGYRPVADHLGVGFTAPAR